MATQLVNVRERFNAKWTPEPFSGCWLWTGCVLENGYGYLWPNKKAHRASWELHRGAIPKAMCVLHKCDVKTCVNPDHLFLGTNTENMRDAAMKGRMPRGENNASAKLTEDDVKQIRSSNEPSRVLGRKFGVTHRTILLIKNGRLWRTYATTTG